MKRKRDALLRQIAETGRKSTVFFFIRRADEQPVGFRRGRTEAVVYPETGTGFFVEPDKIVTTIENLAGAIAVVAIPGERFTKGLAYKTIQLIYEGNDHQVPEESVVNIEGVTAFDAKNNLVLLKIAETGVPLPLENSDNVQIGEKVYTLGYQDDLRYKGAASTLESRYKDDEWLQIKTEFSSGNGGAPLLNSESEVVGVASYGTGSVSGGETATVATAISSNVLKELLAPSGDVMPLDRFQKQTRVHAYALETRATDKGELYDNRGAIKNYNAALKLNPALVEIYSKRGIVKTRIDDMRGALRDFDKMLSINPAHIFAYNNRGSAKAHLEDTHGALDDIHTAIALDPEYVLAYVNLGGIKFQIAITKTEAEDYVEAAQYFQEAIAAYTKALRLDRKNSVARQHLRDAKRRLLLLKILAG
ncbi:MAG: trypsin-like peptidase domain-containing protein [Candidatus Poribacteria bacterium]|nr:trypsin-like peptidase domain-containing protein [Candidatus Poribacteria bacterium]